jgi:hypothetical protein
MFLAGRRASCPVFMFCAPRHVFQGTEGVESHFHVLHSWNRFRRYGGCWVPFSCFARPKSFSAVIRASGPVFMFCSAEHVFGGTKGVRSRFHVLRSRTHFRRYRGRRFPFSCFALLDTFSTVPRSSGPVSCFARPNSFSAKPRASAPVFIFCVPGLVFGGTEGVGSRFHVWRSLTRFRRYFGHRVPFS